MTRLTFDLAPDEQEIFLADVGEHLHALEAGILHLEHGVDPDVVGRIFRAAHTLKALAATIGHQRMAELTHAIETLFEGLRDGSMALTPPTADGLLAAVDALALLRDEVVTGVPSPVDVAALCGRIDVFVAVDGAGERAPERPAPPQLTPEQLEAARQACAAGRSLIAVAVTPDLLAFAPAARLYQAALALAAAGDVIAQAPALDDLTTRATALWALLAADVPEEQIVQRLRAIPDLADVQATLAQIDTLAGGAPAQGAAAHDLNTTVRISVERLDNLMDLVGELMTDRTRLSQVALLLREQGVAPEIGGSVAELTSHLDRVVGQLQEEVMRARMLPIANLFDKIPRLVRDLARTADKQIELEIVGASTELDRSVIEGLHDPLMHLVRNAIDHGIERPAERVASGKPPAGSLRLTATHEEGHIVIAVADDGRGIDARRVARAAVERGLIAEAEAATLSNDERVDMIFWPRLSTAAQVTQLSGRGVGLDAVRTRVERLNGTVALESRVGLGTTFRLTLPLTLTIVPTMLVALGPSVFAIPLASIVDMLALRERVVATVRGSPAILWHDMLLPLLDLRQVFAHPRIAAAPPSARPAVVTVAWGKLRAGLLVDHIIGQHDLVVKALSPLLGSVPGIAGSATLGDGRIALIVDMPSLIKRAMHDRKPGGARD